MLHYVRLGHVGGFGTFVSCSIFLLNIELEEKSFQGHLLIFEHEIALELFPYLWDLVDDCGHQNCLTQKYSFCLDIINENLELLELSHQRSCVQH